MVYPCTLAPALRTCLPASAADEDDDDDDDGDSSIPSWLKDLTRQKSENDKGARAK